MDIRQSAVPIVPCSDLDQSQAFYERLGFALVSDYAAHGYRILRSEDGAGVHLTRTDRQWLDPDRNAHGIYLYAPDVDALAENFGCRAEVKPWGLREFGVSDPDGTLVRVGWPI